jgi:1,4-alpha-glucan branching enzyme
MTRQGQDAASWSDIDGQWWRRAMIYENHLPSFRDGNGDGIGDIRGLVESLEYLDETLGVVRSELHLLPDEAVVIDVGRAR